MHDLLIEICIAAITATIVADLKFHYYFSSSTIIYFCYHRALVDRLDASHLIHYGMMISSRLDLQQIQLPQKRYHAAHTDNAKPSQNRCCIRCLSKT